MNQQKLYNVYNLNLGHQQCITALHPITETTFISGSEDHIIRLWDIDENIPIRQFNDHAQSVSYLTGFDKDQKFVYLKESSENIFFSSSWDKSIKIWSKPIISLFGHSSAVKTMCIQSREKLISGGNQEIILWDLKNLRKIRVINCLQLQSITGIKLQNDNVVVSSLDRTLSIWDQNMENYTQIQSQSGFINSLAIKNQFIIISTGYNFIEIWNSYNNCLVYKQQYQQTIFGVQSLLDNKFCINIGNQVSIFQICNFNLSLLYALLKNTKQNVINLEKIFFLIYNKNK